MNPVKQEISAPVAENHVDLGANGQKEVVKVPKFRTEAARILNEMKELTRAEFEEDQQ